MSTKINILYDQTPESVKVPDPPPGLPECCECGQPSPYFDGEEHFCSKHAPDEMKRPYLYVRDPDGKYRRKT